MVSRDTVGFIWYAQALEHTPLQAMRERAQHPGYPAMVLAAHKLIERLPVLPAAMRHDEVRSWTAAAIGVSMLGGLAVVLACYALTAQLFNRSVGLIAALLAAAAAEFCQLSADGLTDMPHLAIYLTALWATLRGLDQGRLRWFAVAGVLAGLGYLVRPEGAEPAVVAAVLLVTPRISHLAVSRRLACLACLVVCAAVLAGPYMLATGKLVQKKPVGEWLSVQTEAMRSPAGDAGDRACVRTAGMGGDAMRALWPIAENWVRSLRGTYLLAVIPWLIWRRRMAGSLMGTRAVAVCMGLHVVILIALLVRFNYWSLFSLRHVMVLAGLTLPFAAAGVVLLIERLPESRQGWAAVLLGAVLVGPTFPWMFQARFREDAHYRSAAAWMQAETPRRPRIMTAWERMAFYAYGDYIPAPWRADPARYLRAARKTRPDWLAFDERRMLKESPDFFTALIGAVRSGERLELARIETCNTGRGTRRVLIYRYEASGTK